MWKIIIRIFIFSIYMVVHSNCFSYDYPEKEGIQDIPTYLDSLIQNLKESEIYSTEILDEIDRIIHLSREESYIKGLVKGYYLKGDYYYYNYNKDSALTYYEKVVQLASQFNYPLLLGDAYYSIGHIYYEIDQYDRALQAAEKASEQYRNISLFSHLVKSLTLMAEIYNYKGDNEKAINYCIESIKLYEKLDHKKGKANVLNIIGNVYINLKAFDKARKYLNQALALAEEINDPYDQSTTYISFGELYFDSNEYNKALDHYYKAFSIDKGYQDTLGLGYSTFAIGKTLIKLDSLYQGIQMLNESLIYASVVEDYDLQAHIHSTLGDAYSRIENELMAIEHLKKSEEIALTIDELPILQQTYRNLADFYDENNSSNEALKYYKKYMDVSEQINDNENATKIAEIESVYNLTEKEKQIALLKKENEIQLLSAEKRILLEYFLFVIIILIGIIAIILYNRNRLKNKANKTLELQKTAIKKQKEEIEAQKNDIQQQSFAIAEINKHITDSIEYAKKIQLSLLPDNEQLKSLFPESFVFNQPKDIISGDFYWLTTSGNKVFLAVVDCTGHGVPGAFMTVLASSLLNQIIIENKVTAPNIIMSLLDLKMKQHLQNRENKFLTADGMDIALCTIDRNTYKVDFSGARFSFYFTNGRGLQQINGDRHPVGSTLFKNKYFSNKSLQLHKGDMIYLATDGFQDQFGGQNDTKFLKVNFRKLLNEVSHQDISQQVDYLSESFFNWKGSKSQTDDVLVVGIKI